MNLLKSLKSNLLERLNKAKYIKREGTPGKYKYIYKQTKGKSKNNFVDKKTDKERYESSQANKGQKVLMKLFGGDAKRLMDVIQKQKMTGGGNKRGTEVIIKNINNPDFLDAIKNISREKIVSVLKNIEKDIIRDDFRSLKGWVTDKNLSQYEDGYLDEDDLSSLADKNIDKHFSNPQSKELDDEIFMELSFMVEDNEYAKTYEE